MEIEQDYFWVLAVVDGLRRLCKCLSAIIAADHTTPQLNYHNRRNHHYYPTSVTFFTISNFKTIRFTKLKSDFVWAPPPIAFCQLFLVQPSHVLPSFASHKDFKISCKHPTTENCAPIMAWDDGRVIYRDDTGLHASLMLRLQIRDGTTPGTLHSRNIDGTHNHWWLPESLMVRQIWEISLWFWSNTSTPHTALVTHPFGLILFAVDKLNCETQPSNSQKAE